MNYIQYKWVLALPLLVQALCTPAIGQSEIPEGDYYVVAEIEGMIDQGIAVIVERAVEEARNAELLIFVIDTPGGRVDSAIDITNSILKAPCPTVAYVEGMGAISAGAIISYACDHIIMGPATGIGASTPVMMGGESTEAMDKKSYSFVMSKYRALGEENGHSPLLGEAMVDPEIELRGYPNPDGSYTIFKVRDGKTAEVTTSGDDEADAEKGILEQIEEATGADFSPIVKGVSDTVGQGEGEEAAVTEPDPGTDLSEIPEDAELRSAKGELLTLTTTEARKYGLAPIEASSVEEVVAHFGLTDAKRHDIIPNWAEELFAFLTSPMISGLLLFVGLGGIYVEARTPGFGAPGLIGTTCLALFFGAQVIVGLADVVDLLLVALGFGLLAVELLVLPGFGIAGIAGVCSILVGIYLSLTRVPIPEYQWEYDRLYDAGMTAVTTTSLLTLLVFTASYFLPKSPAFRWLTLAENLGSDEGYAAQSTPEARDAVGLVGVATSTLRPAGRGRFEGKNYDIVTRGEFLERGARVRIIQASGNRYVVAECEESE